MATLVLRATNGAPLTNSQVDANFTNLNNDIQTRSVQNYAPLSMANVLPNSSAEMGNYLWTGIATPTIYDGESYWALPNAATSSNFSQTSNSVGVGAAGETLYLQAEISTLGMTAGSGYVQLVWLNSSGTVLSTSAPLSVVFGQNWTYVSGSFVAPTSTSYVQVQFGYSNAVTTNAAIRRIKLSRSPSAYSNEATSRLAQQGNPNQTFQVAAAAAPGQAIQLGQLQNGSTALNPLLAQATLTSNTTLLQSQSGTYFSSNAGLTATLPTSPTVGTYYWIEGNVNGAVTVQCGGANVFQFPTGGTGTSVVLPATYGSYILVKWVGSGWRIEYSYQGTFSAATVGGSNVVTVATVNNYAPTLTGGGASGTWGINISGNAATATSANNSTTTSQTNFATLTLGGSQVLAASNFNTYAPTLTGGGASGTWNISISGNAATCTTANGLNSANSYTAVNFTTTSDQRLKTNIQTLDNALQTVLKLRGVSYDMHGEHEIGLVAQETLPHVPQVVSTGSDPDRTLSIKYGNLGGLFVEAFRELEKEVQSLREQVAELKATKATKPVAKSKSSPQ